MTSNSAERIEVPLGNVWEVVGYVVNNQVIGGKAAVRRYLHEQLAINHVALKHGMEDIEEFLEIFVDVKHAFATNYDEPYKPQCGQTVRTTQVQFSVKELLAVFRKNEENVEEYSSKFSKKIEGKMRFSGMEIQTNAYLIQTSRLIFKLLPNQFKTLENASASNSASSGAEPEEDADGGNSGSPKISQAGGSDKAPIGDTSNKAAEAMMNGKKAAMAPETELNDVDLPPTGQVTENDKSVSVVNLELEAIEEVNNNQEDVENRIEEEDAQDSEPELEVDEDTEKINANDMENLNNAEIFNEIEPMEYENDVVVEEFIAEENVIDGIEDLEPEKEAEDVEDSNQPSTSAARVVEELNDEENAPEPPKNAKKPIKRRVRRTSNTEKAKRAKRLSFSDVPDLVRESHKFKIRCDLEYAVSVLPEGSAERAKFENYFERNIRINEIPYYTVPVIPTVAVTNEYLQLCDYFTQLLHVKTVPTMQAAATPTSLPPLKLSAALYKSASSDAAMILEIAGKWMETGKNEVFGSEPLPPPTPNHDKLAKKSSWQIRAPSFLANDMDELMNEKTEEMAMNLPVLIFRSLAQIAEMKEKTFSFENFASHLDGAKMDVRTQICQSPLLNTDEYGNPCFGVFSESNGKQMAVNVFKKAYDKTKEMAIEKLKSLNRPGSMSDAEDELVKKSMRKVKGVIQCPRIQFGTNIDFVGEECKKIVEEFNSKLPKFLRCDEEKAILSTAWLKEVIPGLNQAQAYIKPPGARTAFHHENSQLGSVNINFGPGSCFWVAIGYEWKGEVEKLIERHNAKKNSKHNFFSQDYWILVEELVKVKIPHMIFEQKKGDLVYLNVGTGHFVASNGYCEHLSYNVGKKDFVQIAAAIISQGHATEKGFKSHFPIKFALWKMAEEKHGVQDENLFNVIRSSCLKMLAYNKMTFDFFVAQGIRVLTGNDMNIGEHGVRCMKCEQEVHNVFLVCIEGKKYVSHCSACQDAQKTYSLFVERPLEDLAQILNAYQFTIPR